MTHDIDISMTDLNDPIYPIRLPDPVFPAYLDEVVYEEGELYDLFEFHDKFGYVMSFSSPEAVVNALTYESTKKTARGNRTACRRWHRTTVGMLHREIAKHDRTM